VAIVYRTPTAERSIDDSWLYVAEHNPTAAERLVRSIDEASKRLAHFPNLGEARDDLASRVRQFCVGNYVLFYRARAGGIELLLVLHGARDAPAVFRDRGIGA
jgi:toxin ParE1/3/4